MIGDEVRQMMPQLQALSESLMQDTIRVDTLSGDAVFDPATGGSSRAVDAVAYEGKARVQVGTTQQDAQDSADEQITLKRYSVSVPVSVTGLTVDQQVTVVSSHDPDLVGRTLTILATEGGTFVTSRRFVASDQQ